MAVSKSVVPDAELNVLKALWDHPPLSAREIAERVYPQVNASSLGTVQKLIARLEDKELLQRDDTKSPHRFTTRVSRAEVAGMQLDEFARKLSGGSLSLFVSHLVQAKKLSQAEKEAVRKLLEDDSDPSS